MLLSKKLQVGTMASNIMPSIPENGIIGEITGGLD